MHKLKYLMWIAGFLLSCNETKKVSTSLINTAHLDHLYQDVNMGNDLQFGAVWIYSNAPEYFRLTDEDEGYSCLDDVSRALVFYCRQYKIDPRDNYLYKINKLTRFIFYMKADNNYYYNFLLPDDEINKHHQNSMAKPNFWTWRAFYALSELCLSESGKLNDLQGQAQINLDVLVEKIMLLFSNNNKTVTIEGIEMPISFYTYGADQMSLIIAGLTNYYKKNPSQNVENLIINLGNDICKMQLGSSSSFPYHSFLTWRNNWHAWGNMQAYALLYAGRILHVDQFIKAGLREVDDFYPYCIETGYLHDFSISLHRDSVFVKDINKFPQIAYDFSPMIFASLEAYQITGDENYADRAGQIATWYFGNNPARQIMYDQFTGRTFDGIESENKVNYNSGAESTIEALLSLQAIELNPVAKKVIDRFIKGL